MLDIQFIVAVYLSLMREEKGRWYCNLLQRGGPCVLVCFCSPPRAARMSSAHFNISGFVDPFCGVKHSRQCGQMFIATLVHHHCSLFRPNPCTTATATTVPCLVLPVGCSRRDPQTSLCVGFLTEGPRLCSVYRVRNKCKDNHLDDCRFSIQNAEGKSEPDEKCQYDFVQ